MRARTTALRGFLAALTIGALAACGDDDDDAASDTTVPEATETTAAEPSDTTAAAASDTTAEPSDTTVAEPPDTTAEAADTTTGATDTTTADGGEFCTLVDPSLLSEVTGLDWDSGEAGEDACTWATLDGSSAFNVTGVEIPDAATARTTAEITCDEGTVEDPGFVAAGLAEFGISCLVTEVPTIQVYGEGILLTFVAYTTIPDVPVEQVRADLATVVEQVLMDG